MCSLLTSYFFDHNSNNINNNIVSDSKSQQTKVVYNVLYLAHRDN